MKYVFISDFFKQDVPGGAEIVDHEIIKSLRNSGTEVTTFHSHQCSLEVLERFHGARFIVSNFINLSEAVKRALGREKYIIYEHDHKYLKTRDPSLYKDFWAPREQLINVDFYRNAIAVVCQSKLHTETAKLNLGIKNIKNASGSLWSNEDLTLLETYTKRSKKPLCAIMDSPNRNKNTSGAIKYCKERGLKYKLIPASSYKKFIEELSECDTFVFFPTTQETLSRVVLEARMLGCKVTTNNLVGAASEPWFKLKGIELIDWVRERTPAIFQMITDTFEEPNPYEDITVILNAYRRPYNLAKQVQAIREQNRPPKQIWLWVNDHQDLEGFDFDTVGADRVFKNNYNWKFYGRFAAALLAETEYIAIFDDDTIPGPRWFENCLDTMKVKEGIMGSAGVILQKDTYNPHERCGWPAKNTDTTRVDLVGHAWFFKRTWLKYLWTEHPTTWDNGEDIQFSYLAQKYGGINTYCPPHPPGEPELHGSLYGNELGIDNKATSTNTSLSHQAFFSERDYCVRKALEGGWRVVRETLQ